MIRPRIFTEEHGLNQCLSVKIRGLILLLLSALVVSAQEPSGVEVVKSSWSKIRIGWERDPFGGPLENFDEMRSRVRNERRVAFRIAQL